MLFVFIVICYLSLVIVNLFFEGAKIQKMLTTVLAEGAKTWRMGRCTLHEGRWATEMLPRVAKWIQKVAQKEPKGPKMEPKGPKMKPRGDKREPRGPKWEPNGSRKRAKIEPKTDPKIEQVENKKLILV